MPKLLFKSGEKKGFIFRLSDEEVTIGRDAGSTIVLSDREISRFHAKITLEGNQYIIEDAGSVNGVFINNHLVTKQALKLDDEIQLGPTVISYLSMDDADENRQAKASMPVKGIPEKKAIKSNLLKVKVMPQHLHLMEKEFVDADLQTLQKGYKRLMTLYRVSHELGRVIDLTKLLDNILELVIEIIKADRGFILLIDKETQELELKAIRSREGQEEDDISISKTLINQVRETGEAILTTDAMADQRFKEAESIILHDIRSTMCVPIRAKDEMVGIMHVDTKGKILSFNKDDLELLTAICNQAGVAIENAKLFESLKRAYDELKDQQSQLIEAERLSALGQLAGGIAHEINNPMTSILGFTELIYNELSKENVTPDKVKDCLKFAKMVIGEAHRCQTITQTLLQFSRRKREEMTHASINDVVEAALTIARFHFKKGPIEIRKEFAENLPSIIGDKSLLHQVFLNLFINAKDAMEEGGTITIKTEKRDDDWIQIRFSDTGCGIPEENLANIFKPLFTTKEEGKGTGLGLSVSRDIIDRHQGTMDVESAAGKGTTFIIRLPVGSRPMPA